jgi:23S rRNA (cytosine1962-C5)-methyltransferase
VGWARENAALSGLAELPIRWITEDARNYVQREVRRGSKYEGSSSTRRNTARAGRRGLAAVRDLPELAAYAPNFFRRNAAFLVLNAYAERISGAGAFRAAGREAEGPRRAIEWGDWRWSRRAARGRWA